MKNSLVVNEYKDYEGAKRAYKQFCECEILTDLIIVDNASNDGTYEKLVELSTDNVHVLRVSGKNEGFSKGFNVGFRYAVSIGSDVIFQCCSDIIFDNIFLSKCVSFLETNEKCGAVSGRQLTPSGDERNSAWMFPDFWNDVKWCFGLWRRYVAPKYYSSKRLDTKAEFVIADSLSGAFTCYRASALEKAGYLDENVFLYNEENIIGKRLRNRGYYLMRINDAFYVHDHIVKPMSRVSFMNELKKSKSGLYLHKYYNNVSRPKLVIYRMALYWYAFEVTIFHFLKGIKRSVKTV